MSCLTYSSLCPFFLMVCTSLMFHLCQIIPASLCKFVSLVSLGLFLSLLFPHTCDMFLAIRPRFPLLFLVFTLVFLIWSFSFGLCFCVCISWIMVLALIVRGTSGSSQTTPPGEVHPRKCFTPVWKMYNKSQDC